LKHLVSLIREKHPSIQHVAVWHAILGYWGGLSPDGKLATTYKTVEVVREDAKRRNLPLGGKLVAVAKEDVPRFYDDFYRFLSSCGVDAVKTEYGRPFSPRILLTSLQRPIHAGHLRFCKRPARAHLNLSRRLDCFHTAALQRKSHFMHVPDSTNTLPFSDATK
jgi:hypothetical protein